MFSNNLNGGLGNNLGSLDTGLSLNGDLNGGLGGGLGNGGLLDQSGNHLSGGPSLLQQTYQFGLANQTNDQNGAQTIQVRKVYLGLTRPQNEQHRRTYDVKITGEAYGQLQESVLRNGSDALNPLNMSQLFSQGGDFNFLHHSGTADGAVSIDNGWDHDRYRFTIVVDIFRNGQYAKTEFVSGYTDYDGVDHAGMISTVKVDPQMVFTINHVTETRLRNMDRNGAAAPMISRSNAVVRNSNYTGFGNPDNLYLTRPSDILKAVDKVNLYKGIQSAESRGDLSSQHYQDLDSVLTTMPMMSNATNLLIPTFASRTIKSMFENTLNKFDAMNLDGAGGASLAATNVIDTAYTGSAFVSIMNRNTGNYVSSTAQFTYHDLLSMDMTIDDRTDVFGRAYETGEISIPDGRNTGNLGMATQIAVHATAVVHATLGLMALAGVCTLAYHASNYTGEHVVTFQAADGLDLDGMLMNRLEALKTRLKLECLSIVASEDSSYEISMFADTFNDVFIKIRWNNDYFESVFPSFASSGMAPTVTKDLNRLVGIAEAIDQVVDACQQVIDPNNDRYDLDKVAIQGNGSSRFGGLAGEF